MGRLVLTPKVCGLQNVGKSEVRKSKKTTAPRIPAWSPTVVLTGRHSG